MAAVAVVVGNPKPQSRTLAAAVHVATELVGEPDLVVDLAALGAALLDWSDPHVLELVTRVGAADLVVVASPTYKGAYTGLLKLFLDRFAGGTGLTGLAVPLMLGGSAAHSLAPEVMLRPVLTEIDGTIDFEDLVEGVSVSERRDESTGITNSVIIDWRATPRGAATRLPR